MRSRSCNNVLFQTPLLEFGGNTGSLSLHPDSGGLFVFPQQLVLADWRPQCQRNLLRREGLRVTCNIFLHLAEKHIYHVRRWTDTFFTGGVMYSVKTTECFLFLFFFFFYKICSSWIIFLHTLLRKTWLHSFPFVIFTACCYVSSVAITTPDMRICYWDILMLAWIQTWMKMVRGLNNVFLLFWKDISESSAKKLT